jgi:endonuclease/exonuclease/phosphatase family metal-dependent hydrolase
MLNKLYRIAIVSMAILTISCGSSKTLKPTSSDIFPPVDDDVMQVVTWNIEQFPKQGNSTLNILNTLIEDMAADIIAVQEVNDTDKFSELGLMLNNYNTISCGSSNPDSEWYNPVVGYIYNKNSVTIERSYKIFQNDNRRFPRTPFVIDVIWKGQELTLINLHLKAMGDNYIDYSDDWDEEVRRKDANTYIADYVNQELADRQVIVLGDFNDEVQEPISTNVFTSFTNSGNFVIADYEMTEDTQNYSFPGWPSHLDHIIINDNLVEEFDSEKSDCFTIKIDNNISGYESLVSDHRPVIIKLDF